MGGDHYHNQGQKDGSDNQYDPLVPISPLDELIWPEETLMGMARYQ